MFEIIKFFEQKFGPDVAVIIFQYKHQLECYSATQIRIKIEPCPYGFDNQLLLYGDGVWDPTRFKHYISQVKSKNTFNGIEPSILQLFGAHRYVVTITNRQMTSNRGKKLRRSIKAIGLKLIEALLNATQISVARQYTPDGDVFNPFHIEQVGIKSDYDFLQVIAIDLMSS